MTIEKVINQLAEEGLDQEVVFAYWDKETIECDADTTLTDEEWSELVEHSSYKMDWSAISDNLVDKIEEMREVNSD